MNKNPILNAFYAAIYIVLVVSVIFNVFGEGPDPDTILFPMAMLGLLVLSVAVMGFLFVLQPLTLFLDGKRVEAISFFTKTVSTFAIMEIVFIIILRTFFI